MKITEFFTSIANKIREKFETEDTFSRVQVIEKLNEWEPIQLTTKEKLQKLANKELKIYVNKTATKLNSFICANNDLIEFICPQVKEFTGGYLTDYFFTDKNKLQRVDSSLSYNNFYKTPNLTILIMRSTELVPLAVLYHISYTKIPTVGYIYVPKTLIEDYKIATNWSVFADRFRAIEDYPEITGGALE